MTTATQLTTFDRMFEIALKMTYRQDTLVPQWADNAHAMAKQLCAKLGAADGAGALASPTSGIAPTTPEGVPTSRFGPAFAGWDDACLQQILFNAQQYAVGMANGAQSEQLEDVAAEIMKSVVALGNAHQQAAAARTQQA